MKPAEHAEDPQGRDEHLIKKINLMGARLERNVKLFSAIARLTELPNRNLSLEGTAGEILEILVMELDAVENCSLLFHESGQDELKLLAAKGPADIWGDRPGDYNRDLSFKPGQGLAGRVFLEKEALFWDETMPGPEAVRIGADFKRPKSLACLPLSVPGGDVGVINISFSSVEPFTQARKRDLVILCEVVGNVVQTVYLKEEVRRGTDDLRNKVDECTLEIEARKRIEDALRRSETRYRELVKFAPVGIFEIDLERRKITSVNDFMCSLTGYNSEELMKLEPSELFSEEAGPFLRSGGLDDTGRKMDPAGVECRVVGKFGNEYWVILNIGCLREGDRSAATVVINNIDDRKRVEEQLRRQEKELVRQAQSLNEANIALKVLLKNQDEEKDRLQENVLASLKLLVRPHLKKLQAKGLDPETKKMVDLIEKALDEIASPFAGKLSSKHFGLTPTEIKVAVLVREGMSSGEIAEFLSVSENAVAVHRKNIRAKLGLKRRKQNLMVYLRNHFEPEK